MSDELKSGKKGETQAITTAGATASSTDGKPTNGGGSWSPLRSLRAETEIHAISRALEESGWNRKHAAKLLSISYRGLLYKIRQYNIVPTTRNDLASAPRPEV
jgi:two-component system, NtrC family, response regulator AtoC